MNPYLFLVGVPRSGRTLLARILDAHSEIAITPETHWITRRLRAGRGIGPDGIVTAEVVDAFSDDPLLTKSNLKTDELRQLVESGLSYPAFVTAFYDLYGRKHGKKLVGDRTGAYVSNIPTLHELFPHARTVHLVRDGRDVCLSMVNWQRRAEHFARRFSTWAEDTVVTAAIRWKRLVSRGRADGAALGEGLYYELRYEALVHEPERECKTLCAFLDLRYEETMLRFHEGRTKREPGLSSKRAWLPITPGLRDWRTQMAPDAVEAFEATAGDLLSDLDYERAASQPGEQARARASRVTRMYREGRPRRTPFSAEALS